MNKIYYQPMLDLSDFLENPDQVYASEHKIAVTRRGVVMFYVVPAQLESNNDHDTKVIPFSSPQLETKHVDNTLTISNYLQSFLAKEALRVERNELTEKSYKVICYRLQKYILPIFGNIIINEINFSKLDSFVDTLSRKGVGGVAISQYLAIIRKILRNATLRGELTRLPEFPKVLGKRKSRGGFNIKEYLNLQQVSWRLRGKQFHYTNQQHLNATGLDQRYMTMSLQLHYLIGFMANSFVRPSDIKVMKHKHVQIINNKFEYLRLSLPETKRHDKPIVTLRRAVSIYKKLLKDSKDAGFGRPDDYVFLPEVSSRDYAMRILGFQFNWLLHETNLKNGPHGIARTLYSLRHTSITFRLLYGQGIDMLTLARNARTSVKMIENHYASTLSGEMNISLLQSKRN